jgi:hypothetical protein
MLSLILFILAAIFVLLGRQVIRARRRSYKVGEFRRYEEIKQRARTGDIILFHKTRRTGLIDSLELDIVSPLFYKRNEFRHCGIVLRDESGLYVLECADERHSGYSVATYVTAGNGVRVVELEPLMREYARDNGDPHFAILHIEEEIPRERFREVLAGYQPVNYLKMHRTAAVVLAHALLPPAWAQRVFARYEGDMMCSEFLHDFLHRCGVLAEYPSKAFVTYAIENDAPFRSLQRVKYSTMVRFDYSPV